MALFLFLLENNINFWIASAPFILAFLQMKIFKMDHKATSICLGINLLVSIYFWVKLKSFSLFIYQIVPYFSTYVCIWSDYICKKIEKSRSKGKEAFKDETQIEPNPDDKNIQE